MANIDYVPLGGFNKHRKTSLKSCTDNDTQNKNKSFIVQKSIYAETFILFKLSLQIGMTFMLEGFMGYIPILFLGHLPDSSQIVSAYSTASSFTYTFAVFPVWGFSSGLWTILPQFLGGNQTHLIALPVQRAFIICFIVQIPLFITLFYSKQILYFIGTNKDIDWDIVTNCCYGFIPVPFAFWITSILQRLAQSLNLSFEITVITGLTFVMSIVLNYICIYTLEFGYIGAVISRILTMFITVLLTSLLLVYKGYSFIFKPLPLKQIFHTNGIIQYLRLSIASGIQVNLEWFPKTFIGLLSGFLNDATVSVSVTSVMRTLNKMDMFHSGIGSAASIRIGKYIGANSILCAKRCIKIQIFCELSIMVFIYIIYTIFRHQLPKLIINDLEVSSFVSNKLIYLLLFNQFNKGIYANVVPIYRALGYSKTSVYVSLTSQYIIAYPLCLYLLFGNTYHYYDNMEIGVSVIWICDTLGYLLAHVFLIFILIYYIDWNKAVEDSNLRIQINNANQLSINSMKTNNNNEKISRTL